MSRVSGLGWTALRRLPSEPRSWHTKDLSDATDTVGYTWFAVWGLALMVWGLGLRVDGFGVWGLGVVWGLTRNKKMTPYCHVFAYTA